MFHLSSNFIHHLPNEMLLVDISKNRAAELACEFHMIPMPIRWLELPGFKRRNVLMRRRLDSFIAPGEPPDPMNTRRHVKAGPVTGLRGDDDQDRELEPLP